MRNVAMAELIRLLDPESQTFLKMQQDMIYASGTTITASLTKPYFGGHARDVHGNVEFLRSLVPVVGQNINLATFLVHQVGTEMYPIGVELVKEAYTNMPEGLRSSMNLRSLLFFEHMEEEQQEVVRWLMSSGIVPPEAIQNVLQSRAGKYSFDALRYYFLSKNVDGVDKYLALSPVRLLQSNNEQDMIFLKEMETYVLGQALETLGLPTGTPTSWVETLLEDK